jgi:hypothetical protein
VVGPDRSKLHQRSLRVKAAGDAVDGHNVSLPFLLSESEPVVGACQLRHWATDFVQP